MPPNAATCALVDMLLYAGANVAAVTRIGQYTPLHLAARDGNGAVVRAMLKAGAAAATPTESGATALHLAAASGSAEAVNLLIDAGADVNAKESESGQTPLIFAASTGQVAVDQRAAQARRRSEDRAPKSSTSLNSPRSTARRWRSAGRFSRPPCRRESSRRLRRSRRPFRRCANCKRPAEHRLRRRRLRVRRGPVAGAVAADVAVAVHPVLTPQRQPPLSPRRRPAHRPGAVPRAARSRRPTFRTPTAQRRWSPQRAA